VRKEECMLYIIYNQNSVEGMGLTSMGCLKNGLKNYSRKILSPGQKLRNVSKRFELMAYIKTKKGLNTAKLRTLLKYDI